MQHICLCFSTGRSGTTYLAHTLKAAYEPDIDVFHEDISEYHSKPRQHLWNFDETDFAHMRHDPAIAAYLARIHERTASRLYVDLGHTVTPLVPLLLSTFPGRVRLLHLVRNPLEAAASMAVRGMYHSSYDGREGRDYPMPPDPRQTRCAHPEYAGNWDTMTPFEKNLWRWAEYHLFALATHDRYPAVPYMRMLSDTLFSDPACPQYVARFYGLPQRPIDPKPAYRNETHPNLTSCIAIADEWRRYVQYPYILDLANELGAPVEMEKCERIIKKYAAPNAWEIAKYRWKLRLTREWWLQKVRKLRSTIEREAKVTV